MTDIILKGNGRKTEVKNETTIITSNNKPSWILAILSILYPFLNDVVEYEVIKIHSLFKLIKKSDILALI
jgi:hypothetical protein